MSETCTNNPRDCPYLHRIEALEAGQEREENFRKAYYSERESRIERDAKLDAKITGMDEKLDKVVAWQETQQAKPAKRWDGLVDKLIYAAALAVVAWIAAGAPGLG